jgi:hypothetical protein
MAAAVWTACTKKLFQEKKWSPGEPGALLFLLKFLGVFWEKHGFERGFLMVKLWCFAW